MRNDGPRPGPLARIRVCANCSLLIIIGSVLSVVSPPPARAQLPTPARTAPVVLAPDDQAPAKKGTSRAEPSNSQADGDEPHCSTFKQVTPGVTPREEILRLLGEPADQINVAGRTKLVYDIRPFARVEISLVDQIAASIVIYLGEPTARDELARELGLTRFAAAPIPDENGRLLGQVYPERAILFAFRDNDPALSVTQVILDPLTAEPFVLRAEHDLSYRYDDELADLRQAVRLDPNQARAYWLQASLLAEVGQTAAALRAATQATRLAPTAGDYRLTAARLLAETGEPARALEETKAVLVQDNAPAEVKARAECQLGDLLANFSKPDFQQAIEHHQQAIKLATPLAADERFQVRRAAKRVLIDAHLAVAGDVARGNWRRQLEVTTKWAERADLLVEDFVTNERGDQTLRLLARRCKLQCLAELPAADPTADVNAAVKLAEQLAGATDDPLRRQRVRSELGESLLAAARIHMANGNADAAEQLVQTALQSLAQDDPQLAATPQRDYLLGRLYFTVGAAYGVLRNNHEQAVVWYDKADRLLSQPLPGSAAAELRMHGERFVSMGVSYWTTGDRQRGLALTKTGVEHVQRAVAENGGDKTVLVIPYGNLSSMNRELGNIAEAELLAERAGKLEAANGTQRR